MAINAKLSAPMLNALKRAAGRERGNVCPVAGKCRAASEMSLLHALRRRGLIDGMDENGMGAPYINDAGRAAVAQATPPVPGGA